MNCAKGLHSWAAIGFVHHSHREGGGIANVVKRRCSVCPAEHEQIEVHWPDGHYTVEPVESEHASSDANDADRSHPLRPKSVDAS